MAAPSSSTVAVGSDEGSMNTRDRVGSREGTGPGPSGSEVSPWVQGYRGDRARCCQETLPAENLDCARMVVW